MELSEVVAEALLLSERLMRWSDAAIEKDLGAYPNVSPADARQMRDTLSQWLESEGGAAS